MTVPSPSGPGERIADDFWVWAKYPWTWQFPWVPNPYGIIAPQPEQGAKNRPQSPEQMTHHRVPWSLGRGTFLRERACMGTGVSGHSRGPGQPLRGLCWSRGPWPPRDIDLSSCDGRAVDLWETVPGRSLQELGWGSHGSGGKMAGTFRSSSQAVSCPYGLHWSYRCRRSLSGSSLTK